jgi:predicted DNA-binding transcriptional regulator AlpA
LSPDATIRSMHKNDSLLTRSEVARLLAVSTRTVARMETRGALTPVPALLPTIRYDAAEVQALLTGRAA